MRRLSNARHNEFEARSLGVHASVATALLDHVASDGWIEKAIRYRCPVCQSELTETEARESSCPNSECHLDFADNGGVTEEHFYKRSLAAPRSVAWIVAIHGMNTRGEWQERLTWLISTTWGRAIPTAIYKYGVIRPGVILFWRRRKLRTKLRDEIAQYKAQLVVKSIHGVPDVIAHSFGTWLIGHVLLRELELPPSDRLTFGRIVLVGSILRPDFDWLRLQRAGVVQEVLNHFGDCDPVVPMAHYSIWDSGPSGRQGFMGSSAINVRASGYGHDDLFSMVKKLPTETETVSNDVRESFMGSALYKTWRPFFENPATELTSLATEPSGGPHWRQSIWPLRGTLFPFVIIPAFLLFVAWLFSLIVHLPYNSAPVVAWLAYWFGIAVGFYFLLVACSMTWNWATRSRKIPG